MNIIVCTNSNILQVSLAHKMIPQGINLIKLNTLEEVAASIPVHSDIALIDDTNLDQKQMVKMIVDIKKDENKKSAKLLLITKSSDIELIKVFTKLGATFVLQSSLHPDTITDKFFSFLQQFASQHKERRFVRIKLESKEENLIKLLLPNKTYTNGIMSDISMGGLAGKFPQNDISLMMETHVYPNCQISIDGKNILADLRLVKKGGDILAFSFEKMRDTFKDHLAEIIYRRIQKNLIQEQQVISQ